MEDKNPIHHSLELIENQISEKLTVGYIASRIHLSKFHYQRVFREWVGECVMEYVTKRKLTLAGAALLETDTAIVDIAMQFGFDSREGFARSFKAYMGVAPGEYRKYALASIEKKTVKERGKMRYAKATDEIIRALNRFVVMARETTQAARKEKLPEYTGFWAVIADKTDALADKVQNTLAGITAIAERPDEIVNRFAILRVIGDTAFDANILAFYTGLTVSRSQPQHILAQHPMCQKYLALAEAAVLKTSKIAAFFNDLAALIFEDINKAFALKMQESAQTARSAIAPIAGYDTIKSELGNIIEALETLSFDENAPRRLEDFAFRLIIISFAADMDIFRNPHDKEMFAGLAVFKDTLAEAIGFTETLPKGAVKDIGPMPQKHMQDIAFQGNFLLFHTRDEIEKLNKAKRLDDDKNRRMNAVCDKINNAIRLAINAAGGETDGAPEQAPVKEIAQIYTAAAIEMAGIAGELGTTGRPVSFLANEINSLAGRVRQ